MADITRIFDATLAEFGHLDILVNNAGIMFMKPVSAVTEAEYDRIFAVNVKGTFFALPAGGDPAGGRRTDHQLLQLDDGAADADLRGLCGDQGGGRATDPLARD